MNDLAKDMKRVATLKAIYETNMIAFRILGVAIALSIIPQKPLQIE